MLEISLVGKQLSASQEGQGSLEVLYIYDCCVNQGYCLVVALRNLGLP
jgi:hypothetical protein